MVSGLGWAKGLSFNGPVWSVSIEVFLYLVFFIVCMLNKRAWWHLLPFVIAGVVLISVGTGPLANGLVAFFMGGLSYSLFERVRLSGMSASRIYVVAALVGSL